MAARRGALVDTVSATTAVHAHGASIELAGNGIDVSLIGFAMIKNSPLIGAVSKALNYMIAHDTYGDVLKKWHLSDIGVTKAVVNDATKAAG